MYSILTIPLCAQTIVETTVDCINIDVEVKVEEIVYPYALIHSKQRTGNLSHGWGNKFDLKS